MCFSFEVEATHLLTASLMSAPAPLAIAKTFWPETETLNVTTSDHDFKMDKKRRRGQNRQTYVNSHTIRILLSACLKNIILNFKENKEFQKRIYNCE